MIKIKKIACSGVLVTLYPNNGSLNPADIQIIVV